MNSRTNKRSHMRQQHARKVEFSIIEPDAAQERSGQGSAGTLIDISTSGIGFYTDVPLEPGDVLKFRNMKADNTGIVMWTVRADNRYRVGVRFAPAEQAQA
ncbi:MAG: hypothetical protein A2X56_01640 [Nitrospirae bacterium GWC2_57_13]|jgi:hypothetical protein|nr:MAG: hypothetical protein A2072_01685 [Nitrospirae bacterium GWC1_57_7]OGW26584.1 MAG: hypothetical protein A2X56_01640 [Nitrospirae bacterium GWC2_57_13]OGW44111.1 MAG: hypothetical protein A2X57_07855 [Nitrospirae bacterium GWD2_57_8]HAS53184.1 hypothetical protein [Nitrospiraceae bacterium]